VSLAIYIYGVVNEFLRLVRQEDAYGELTRAAGVKPTIDVIFGSSAGGINGLFLAKALASGADLSPLKELWIQQTVGIVKIDIAFQSPDINMSGLRYNGASPVNVCCGVKAPSFITACYSHYERRTTHASLLYHTFYALGHWQKCSLVRRL
jgi:hypothetical protein